MVVAKHGMVFGYLVAILSSKLVVQYGWRFFDFLFFKVLMLERIEWSIAEFIHQSQISAFKHKN